MGIYGGIGQDVFTGNVTTAARLDRLAAAPLLAHLGQVRSPSAVLKAGQSGQPRAWVRTTVLWFWWDMHGGMVLLLFYLPAPGKQWHSVYFEKTHSAIYGFVLAAAQCTCTTQVAIESHVRPLQDSSSLSSLPPGLFRGLCER